MVRDMGVHSLLLGEVAMTEATALRAVVLDSNRERLREAGWPGNVAELTRAVSLTAGIVATLAGSSSRPIG